MTDGTGDNRYYTVQSVDVRRAGQAAAARIAERRRIAGMANRTRGVDDSVVMRRRRRMGGGTIFMTGIAGEVVC